MFVLTGDYVSHEREYIAPGRRRSRQIKAKYGTYACLGNHDHWTDAELVTHLFRGEGINMLVNEGFRFEARGGVVLARRRRRSHGRQNGCAGGASRLVSRRDEAASRTQPDHLSRSRTLRRRSHAQRPHARRPDQIRETTKNASCRSRKLKAGLHNAAIRRSTSPAASARSSSRALSMPAGNLAAWSCAVHE